MPYGKGGRLGEGIDPRLMQVDYSGYADVGRTQGQALANMGAQIGGLIKQHGETQKSLKATETTLKALNKNFAGTPIGDQTRDLLEQFYNPDTSTRDKLGIQDSLNNIFQFGIAGMEQRRQQQLLELQRQELMIKAAKAGAGGQMMVMTPSQIDQYTNAGYNMEIEGQNPDGTFVVKTMERKGVGSGGVVPFYNETTGAFGFQQAPPQFYSPTPGADPSMIQRAAQGFTQPPVDPSMIQQAAQGVTQPPLPAAGVDATGPVAIGPSAQLLPTPATGVVPNADFFAQEGQEAVRVPGSMRDLEAQLKQQQISQAKAETAKSEMEVTEAKEKEAKGRDSFSSYVGNIANAYAELDKAGAAISTRKGPMENIKAFAAGTDLGKSVGSAVGSEASSFRAIIDSQTPGIINVIRQSSEMGARGMDSDAERKFYITALGAQTLPVEANVRALIELDKAYGKGEVANIVREKNPALYARAMSDKYVYKSGKKDDFVVDDEVESILQELGL